MAGLTPGTAYTFEVRGRNADGPGPAAQVTGTTAAAVSITGVALTSNPAMGTTYDTGEDVVATLTFSRPVTFAEVGGNLPQLELDFGGTGKPATCAATNQQTAVVCTYTVVSGDTASAGVAIGANKLTLNGGTIRLGSGANTNLDYTVPLAHTALAADTGHKVSATSVNPPEVSSIALTSTPGNDETYAIGDDVVATVTFDSSVDITGTPQLELDFDGTAKAADCTAATPSTTMACSYEVVAGDSAPSGVAIAANKLTGGTITAAGTTTAAVLTHAAVAASASHKVDGVKPTLVITGADAPKTSTDGTKVILTFSENITLTFGTAFVASYTVTIGGTAATVDSVEVTPGNLARIELMLASTNTVAAGDTVTVALDSDAVLDGAGNSNDALAATAVINAVTAAPTVDSIAFNSAGSDNTFATGDAVTATVTFNEAVTVDTTGGTPHLTIDVGGTDTGLNYASGTGTTALVFSGYMVAPNHEDTDGISIAANKLDANGGTIKATADATLDAVLNHAAVADSASHKVDGVKPTLVTTGDNAPKTSTDGTKILIAFSESIKPVTSLTGFTVTVNGSTATIDSSGNPGGAVGHLTLTLDSADTIAAGGSVTLALAADAVFDDAGNGIAAVSATTVIRVSAPGPPVLTAAAKTESIELSWTIADHGSSDITRFEYRIKETTGGTYPATWTDTGAAASNTGGSATIGSLTNGTQYTVQVRGVNSEGEGADSNEPTATPDAPPMITSVAITSDPGTDMTYIIGDDIEFTVTFDKTLTLAGSDTTKIPGTLGWRLDYAQATSGVDHPEANCEIGTNMMTAVCTNAVQEGWYDTDGIAVNANNLSDFYQVSGFVGPLGQRVNREHSALPVDANHKIDGVKPTLSSANASGDLTKVVLTFSEAIGTVDNAEIKVKKGGTRQTTTGAAIDSTNSTKVEITLMTAFLNTDTNITVELDADAVKDVPGNGIAEVLGTAVSLVDNTAPTFVSAGTSGTDKVVLTYSEALDTGSQPATSAFTVEVGGEDRGVDTVAISGRAVTLTLASAFRPGDALTVSYAKPGSNPIKDAANNEAVSLAETTVTNNLAATAPEAPGGLSADFDEISTAPLRLAADILELSWVTPWHNGSPIEKYQYRYAAGSSVPPSTTWTDVPGGANEIGLDVTGLDADTEYTFEVRAVNGIGNGDAATAMRTTPDPAWSFTLTDSGGNAVTQFTEGGDPATATVSITNNVRFSTAQTVTLKWGTVDLSFGAIVGAGGASSITIPAEGTSGTLEISSPQRAGEVYDRPRTEPLTATHAGTQIGNDIDLTRLDDEEPPVASITQAPTTVTEGGNIEIEVALSVGYSGTGALRFTVTDSDGALSGTPPDRVVLAGTEKTQTFTLTTDDNGVQNDGAREVTVTLGLSPDIPYTLDADASSVTVTVLDNDTPASAPQDLMAQAGDTTARLTWQAPLPPVPDHRQPVLHYEYQVKVGTGSFSAWATIQDSDANTTSHTFTGLVNDMVHTFEVRAVNVAGGGAEAQVMVTPIVGVAVSFAEASLSVDEGDIAVVTLTLAEAPAAGTTVTVPIVATGAVNTDVVNVPMEAIFAAGETSKTFTMFTVPDTFDEPDRC